MEESPGKRASRDLFYYECLSEWFSEEEIQASHYLLLLGEEMREIPFLNELGVDHSHVWSIENNHRIYQKQRDNDVSQASLYYGEMSRYLKDMLHSNQRFQIFNLDIAGPYLNNLDASMTSVLLYAWRNPRTIISTYSSAGRDVTTLWEGILSLALFLKLSKEKTLHVLSALRARYAGSGHQEIMRFAFRDFFWMRSLLDHTVIASALVHEGLEAHAKVYQQYQKALWHAIKEQQWESFTLEELIEKLDLLPDLDIAILNIRFNLVPEKLYTFQYRAVRPWNHAGKAVMFERTSKSVLFMSWLHQLYDLVLENPLVHIDSEGDVSYYLEKGGDYPLGEDETLWPDDRIFRRFEPRELTFTDLKGIPEVRKSIDEVVSITISQNEGDFPMSKECESILVDSTNSLTEFGGDVCKRLGGGYKLTSDMYKAVAVATPNGAMKKYVVTKGRQRRLSSSEIAELLPGDVPIRFIAPHVAHARKDSWKPN